MKKTEGKKSCETVPLSKQKRRKFVFIKTLKFLYSTTKCKIFMNSRAIFMPQPICLAATVRGFIKTKPENANIWQTIMVRGNFTLKEI
jgi:hypothetical protein